MTHPTARQPEPDGFGTAALDPLLTRQQSAEYLTISPRFLDGEAAAGRLAPVRLGRFVRYRVSELERYLTACAEASSDGRR